MSFLELSLERYSVRKFSEKKVEREKIEKILIAANNAPTAANKQPHQIYIVESEEGINKLKECTPYCFNASTIMIVCYNLDESWKRSHDEYDGGTIDAAIVGTHIMMQVADMGLGTTWVGMFDSEKIKKLFNLPKNIVPVGLFPIGYISDDCEPSQNHFSRKELFETIKFL